MFEPTITGRSVERLGTTILLDFENYFSLFLRS